MVKWIDVLYHNPIVSRVFHTSVYCLKRELTGCRTVLDLGCGPDSPIRHCAVPYSVGVDAFQPYLDASREKKIHSGYILADITSLEFPLQSFDAVMMVEVLEHMPTEEGRMLLDKVERWASKKVIVSCPNGYLPQHSIDGNPFQEHRSGWTVDEMNRRGYRAWGMAGWKFLRKENETQTVGDTNAIYATVRFRPKLFWLIVSELTQAITYFSPKLAFEVFYVKEIGMDTLK